MAPKDTKYNKRWKRYQEIPNLSKDIKDIKRYKKIPKDVNRVREVDFSIQPQQKFMNKETSKQEAQEAEDIITNEDMHTCLKELLNRARG